MAAQWLCSTHAPQVRRVKGAFFPTMLLSMILVSYGAITSLEILKVWFCSNCRVSHIRPTNRSPPQKRCVPFDFNTTKLGCKQPVVYVGLKVQVFRQETMPSMSDTEQQNTSRTRTQTPSSMRAVSRGSTGSNYLQNALGDVLADALSEVAKKRPTDPIEYVANYLHSVSGSSKNPSSSNTVNDSDDERYSRQKQKSRRRSREPSVTRQPSTNRNSRRDKHFSANTVKGYGIGNSNFSGQPDYHSENSSGGADTDEYYSRSRRRRRTARSEPMANNSLGPSTASTSSSFGGTGRRIDKRFRSLSLNRDESFASNRSRKSYSRYKDTTPPTQERHQRTRSKSRSVQKRKPTTFSRRVPSVALTPDEYRVKRGLKLPPMSRSPSRTTYSNSDPSSLHSFNSGSSRRQRKPLELDPLEPGSFDINKHRRRTNKLIEQRLR